MMDLIDKFGEWFRGDEGAVNFARMIWVAAQEWDDLEDEGKCSNHNALLSWLAFGKEYDPYFAAHQHILRPVFLSTYLQWMVANVLEKGDKNDVSKAYMLRAGIYGIWHMMAWIAGGDDWAAKIGPDIYRQYGETPESLWQEFNNA